MVAWAKGVMLSNTNPKPKASTSGLWPIADTASPKDHTKNQITLPKPPRSPGIVSKRRASEAVTVSSGASAGLFRFLAKDAGDADAIRDEIERQLGAHEELQHATFVVDLVAETREEHGGFRLDAERLLALGRFRQMRAPSVAVPTGASSDGAGACALEGIRPATQTLQLLASPS